MEPLVFVISWIAAVIVGGASLKLLNKRLDEKQIPLMAILELKKKYLR
jgi:hypothetical protein